MSEGPVFATEVLRFQYERAAQPALTDLTLAVERGDFWAVIGPNGSGKSTLLRLLLGVLEPASGRALYAGRPARDWPRRELARRVGVVSQSEEPAFPIAVRELVAMGRYPHLGPWRAPGPADEAAIERAMARCQLNGLSDRPLSHLSAGERQRARIARALAQEPDTLALDEPTASLDIAHEMEIFELLSEFADEGGTVFVVTHNLNLASRFASRLLLLDGGRAIASGSPADVLDESTVERVYQWPVRTLPYPEPGRDEGAPQIIPLRRR